jgi:hypothetical protein
MPSQQYTVEPISRRPHYQGCQIRGADLDDGDVLWNNNEWRFVAGVYRFDHMRHLDSQEVSKEDLATLRKHLTGPKLYVVAELRNEDPDRLRDTELLPVRFYDLVTIQTVAGRVASP